MLKSSSLVDLNSRHQLRSGPSSRSSSINLAKENLNIRNFNNILKEYQYNEDNLEKTKKKRVILKSRQKFPSDFFNEGSDAPEYQGSQRFPIRCESSKLIKAKRSNSTASDNTPQTKTPKFSSGMSIFINSKSGEINNKNDNKIQASSSKLLTEEYDDVYLPNQFPIAKVYKFARSQSLVSHQTDTLKIPLQRQDIPNGITSDNYSRLDTDTQQISDIEASPIEKKGILRSKSLNKRRMSSFSGFHNCLGVERLRSEANVSGYKDFDNSSQLSTDISRKIFSREIQRNYSDKLLETSNIEFEPYGRALTPEKGLVNLPSIKKEISQIDLGRLQRENNFMAVVVPSSHREIESLHTERPYYRVGSSYCSATKPMNMPPRIQSQGGKLECFGRRDGMRSLINGVQSSQKMESPHTIFSTKTMVRFHNSIIKVLNQNIPNQLQKGDVRGDGDLQRQEKEDVVTRLSMKPVEFVNEENLLGQSNGVVKEKRDPCEFSFSKNFYKDKSRSVLSSALQNSIRGQKEQSKIGKKLREPNQEYLKSKSKIFVDSDIKRKFSIVRFKQMQS